MLSELNEKSTTDDLIKYLRGLDFEVSSKHLVPASPYQHDITVYPPLLFTKSQMGQVSQNNLTSKLPSEILQQIASHCKLSSIPNLLLANSHLYKTLHDIPYFTGLFRACSNAMRALYRNGCRDWFELNVLLDAFQKPYCKTCGKPAQYFYIPAESRCCLLCATKSCRLQVSHVIQEIYKLEDEEVQDVLRYRNPLVAYNSWISPIQQFRDIALRKYGSDSVVSQMERDYWNSYDRDTEIVEFKERRREFYDAYDTLSIYDLVLDSIEAEEWPIARGEIPRKESFTASALPMAYWFPGETEPQRFLPPFCQFWCHVSDLLAVDICAQMYLEEDIRKHLETCECATRAKSGKWTIYDPEAAEYAESEYSDLESTYNDEDNESEDENVGSISDVNASDSEDECIFLGPFGNCPTKIKVSWDPEGRFYTYGRGPNLTFLGIPMRLSTEETLYRYKSNRDSEVPGRAVENESLESASTQIPQGQPTVSQDVLNQASAAALQAAVAAVQQAFAAHSISSNATSTPGLHPGIPGSVTAVSTANVQATSNDIEPHPSQQDAQQEENETGN